MKSDTPGLVYFAQRGNRSIKIGFTRVGNLKARLSALNMPSEEKLVLLVAVPGTLYDERLTHFKFKEFRLAGEWFSVAPEILNYVGELKNNSDAITVLPTEKRCGRFKSHSTSGSRHLSALCKPPPRTLTVTELAKKLGVSRVTIHSWLNGDTLPSKKHAKALEELLGIPAQDWKRPAELGC